MKRIIVALVIIFSIITAVGLLTLFTFAVPQNGDQCTTEYVDKLVGSDGDYFFRNGVQTSIKYYSDGSSGIFSHENYGGPREHSLIKVDGDANYYGYCIEQGASFPDALRYSGVGWINDSYFSNLPTTVQTGIMLATIFGWQPGKNVPVLGCNEDDWYWATQVIIWEYQQKLRNSPINIQGNGYVSANYFQSTLAGRNAEKCYNYILESMAKYQVIPSFTTIDSNQAPLNVLKWDSTRQQWCVTLNDTNQSGQPLTSDDSTLRIEQNGNLYTFYSSIKFETKNIKFKKAIAMPSHEMLIWGGANRTQAIATGVADPIQFFGQFRTEQPGTLEIVKSSEDGAKEGFQFEIIDQNGQVTNLETNVAGIANLQLLPGEYLISEKETVKYRIPQAIKFEIKENETTHLVIDNILKKGQIKIQKNVIDSIASKTIGEKGAVFQIYSSEYPMFDGTPKNLREEVTTDDQGVATSKELPLGKYIVHQTFAGKNITISQDLTIVLENDMQTLLLPIENQLQKGQIQILKRNNAALPLAGGVFIIRAAEDILQSDGKLRYAKGSLIDLLTTDVNGLTSSDWLYPGTYDLEEIKPPEGYVLPTNPVTTVVLTTENQTAITFFKSISIENNIVETYPNTGDETRTSNARIIVILMLMSLIGIGVLAYMMREQNKTLH